MLRKTTRIKDLLPTIESAGYIPEEAKKILLRSVDSMVRAFHVVKLTSINKLIFLKYFQVMSDAVRLRLQKERASRYNQSVVSDIKQATETVKVNDYIKEKLVKSVNTKSGSVIVFQYTDEKGNTSNRTALVVGGNQGPEKTWFVSKQGEIYLKTIDLSKVSDLNQIYEALKRQRDIQDNNKGESPDISYSDLLTNPQLKGIGAYNNFRSFNVNRISYMSTIKLESSK